MATVLILLLYLVIMPPELFPDAIVERIWKGQARFRHIKHGQNQTGTIRSEHWVVETDTILGRGETAEDAIQDALRNKK